MPTHVHLILVPADADGLRRALAPAHRRYAGHVHARLKRTGHFWQGRYGAVVMDEDHLAAAVRYVVLNPVRARLVKTAPDWAWSSARAHLSGMEDGLTTLEPLRQRFPDFADLLGRGREADLFDRIRKAESVGRPLGSETFPRRIEAATGRSVRPVLRSAKTKAAGRPRPTA